MKKSFSLLTLILVLLTACGRKEVVIFYENDMHCAVDGYVHIAMLRDQASEVTPYTAVVSAGDFIQGDVVGSISEGEYIVDIMNAVGYDAITIGNHEFDYGLDQHYNLMSRLNASVVCANLSHIGGSSVHSPYVIHRYGPVKVAYVGAATPTTYNTSTPTYFVNEQGELCYDFHTTDTYEQIQMAVDDARQNGADYVIVLSHLGDDGAVAPSVGLIQQTTGIDVVVDGHQHHVLNCHVANAHSDSVILTSTGTKAAYIGKITIPSDGAITAELIPSVKSGVTLSELTPTAKQVKQTVDDILLQMQAKVERVIGYTEVALIGKGRDGERATRNGETNIADFIADAMRQVAGAEIGMIHGGSIRADLPQGDITIGSIISVLPFNNSLAVVEATGQQLLDAMEVGVMLYPEENGDFHIASGLRYTIDEKIPTSVQLDEHNMFVGVGGTRRIVKMEVLNDNNQWVPIDPNQTYTVGGLNYTLTSGGASGMFRMMHPIPCNPIKDTEILQQYIQSLGDTVRAEQYAMPDKRFSVR